MNVFKCNSPQNQSNGTPVRKNKAGHQEFFCSVCEYRTVRKDRLKEHITTHTKERKYACGICQKTYKTFKIIKRHIYEVHKKCKKYPCETCGVAFPNCTHYNRHLRSKKHARNEIKQSGAETSKKVQCHRPSYSLIKSRSDSPKPTKNKARTCKKSEIVLQESCRVVTSLTDSNISAINAGKRIPLTTHSPAVRKKIKTVHKNFNPSELHANNDEGLKRGILSAIRRSDKKQQAIGSLPEKERAPSLPEIEQRAKDKGLDSLLKTGSYSHRITAIRFVVQNTSDLRMVRTFEKFMQENITTISNQSNEKSAQLLIAKKPELYRWLSKLAAEEQESIMMDICLLALWIDWNAIRFLDNFDTMIPATNDFHWRKLPHWKDMTCTEEKPAAGGSTQLEKAGTLNSEKSSNTTHPELPEKRPDEDTGEQCLLHDTESPEQNSHNIEHEKETLHYKNQKLREQLATVTTERDTAYAWIKKFHHSQINSEMFLNNTVLETMTCPGLMHQANNDTNDITHTNSLNYMGEPVFHLENTEASDDFTHDSSQLLAAEDLNLYSYQMSASEHLSYYYTGNL